MKAVQIFNYGDADQLKIETIDRPQAKENQVLVRIRDAGVNPYDWKVRAGYMKDVMPVHFPMTLGYDFAGEVVELGANVRTFQVGDRVFGFVQGAYAEFAVAETNKIALLPDEVSFEMAASLPTPGLTAYQLMMNFVRAHSRERILIHGAAGAVGSIAVQIAKALGSTVYANASVEDEGYLKNIGVSKVIDYKTQKFEEFCVDLDAIVDLVGGETLERSYQCVKKGGLLISTVGPMNDELAKRYQIEAKFFLADHNSADLLEMANLVARGKVKPRLAEILPLEKAAIAQTLSETGHAHGKIVLHVK